MTGSHLTRAKKFPCSFYQEFRINRVCYNATPLYIAVFDLTMHPVKIEDIVLVGGSNKSVEVFDMNVGSSIRTLPDAHNRAVHCIYQNNVCHSLGFE